MTTWAIVSTIKAPLPETLRFVAYHLSLGAHHIYVYLDDANNVVFDALKAHPRVRPVLTDDVWWAKRGRRPVKHQVRQSRNATHCYRRFTQEDWLIHMDVDEFLAPENSIENTLSTLPGDALCARVRPMEQLSGDPNLFKAFVPRAGDRHRLVEELYPTFGPFLKSGFLSHTAGKVFVRTGHADIKLRIHNAMLGDTMLKNEIELEQISLAHAHARSWDQFRRDFRFRLEKGSYRADLAPERSHSASGLTLHQLFEQITASDGEAGLRAFFDEVCAASPRLVEALDQRGLLRRVDLDLEQHVRKHFPEHT